MKKVEENAVEKVDQKLVEKPKEYVPATDICEKDDVIILRCDMPGVLQDQIDIRLENNELEIVGTQSVESYDGMELLAEEYKVGVFRRKFSIPNLIDHDQIKARLKNGVLNIELPKEKQAKPRKIEITTGS